MSIFTYEKKKFHAMLSGKLHHRPLQLAHTLMLEIFLCVKGGHKQCFL